jgi:hypothetical protein
MDFLRAFRLWIFDVPELVAFSAPLLWRARTLHVQDNDALTTLDFASLSTLVRDLVVRGNAKLANLSGLGQLSSGLRRLEIEHNPVLGNVDGLRGLGDALQSDPIVIDRCSVVGNANGSSALIALLGYLDTKFPGQALYCR